jgi:predicted N-acetyltransferase YhbS
VRERVRLRDATEDDIPALIDVINAAYKPVDWWLFGRLRTSEAEYREEFRLPGASAVVAELDGRIVAHIAISLGYWDGAAWFGKLSAVPEAQGQGVATLLVEEAERRARDAGYDVLYLDCVRENGLVEYYESLGYAVVGEKVGRELDALHDWTRSTMSKRLR